MGDSAVSQLAEWLREQRQLARLSYRQIAKNTNYHHTTLQRAASGDHMPTWDVVQAYTQACNADLKTARKHWKTAKYWHHIPSRKGTRKTRPATIRPEGVDTFAQILAVMQDIRRLAGWPSFKELDKRARALNKRLPPSTLALVLENKAPLHKDNFMTYLQVCGIKSEQSQLWEAAWDRANRSRLPTSTPATEGTTVTEIRQALTGSDGDPVTLVRVLIGLKALDS